MYNTLSKLNSQNNLHNTSIYNEKLLNKFKSKSNNNNSRNKKFIWNNY